ncbi:MAG: sigma-54-dependent Fis family transcriptional regulator [bacterium]|nr:sigma-54-dependent Fis family transcriptional regulator [bacterium]
MSGSGWRESLDDSTQAVTARRPQPEITVPGLTILCHPDLNRVGEVAAMPGLLSGKAQDLSRLDPLFSPVGSENRQPLAHPRISRKPFGLYLDPDGRLVLERRESPIRLVAGGQRLKSAICFSNEELQSGAVLFLADRITILLHMLSAVIHRPPRYGLVGESSGIVQVRLEIERVADTPYAVLLLGESGTGKELAARAIHEGSQRRGNPFLSVNMGAIPPSLAASELFGAAKGAFTGATREQPGYFQRAAGGTLFLDEIGETPLEVQVLLLRALESGQIQPVGAKRPLEIDVRVISATDLDLTACVESGEFRSPLLYRLSNYTIEIPPLRERREDIGRLFFHFLQQEMKVLSEEERLLSRGVDERPWMSAELISRLAAYYWPGNVRELQNVVRELAVASRGFPEVQGVPKVERLLRSSPQAPPGPAPTVSSPLPVRAPAGKYRDPDAVGIEELKAALKSHRYVVNKAAAQLDISRPSLYKLMERHVSESAQLLKTKDLR